MKNERILEMLNRGEIEELKARISEEIFQASLKKTVAAERYKAMKRYFKYAKKTTDKRRLLPCKDVLVNGESYTSFCDAHSFVLTTEDVGNLETFNKSDGDYFNIEGFVDFGGDYEEIDLSAALAEVKAKGYKPTRWKESSSRDCVAIRYRNAWYNAQIVDTAYSIIEDGKKAEVWYRNGVSVLMVKTSVGLCGILPFRATDERVKKMENTTVIASKYDEADEVKRNKAS